MQKHRMLHDKTTAYHPQANGQVERANREIKQYLRKYIDFEQDNWTDFLPMAEYAYNTKTGKRSFSPYQIVYRETPEITAKKLIGQIHREEQEEVSRPTEKNLPAPEYREGEYVYLQRVGGQKGRPSPKLDHRYWGPFRIKRQVSPQAYELDLPSSMKVHPVFNTERLKKHYRELPKEGPAPEVIEGVKEFEVEAITGERKGGREFRVKWVGYREPTWEPIGNLRNTKGAVQRWKKRTAN